MKRFHSWPRLAAALAGLGIVAATGCQTHIAGMTLPSYDYLKHRPQYHGSDPDFPLQRELATQRAQDDAIRAANGGRVGGAGVAPVVPPAATPTPPQIAPPPRG